MRSENGRGERRGFFVGKENGGAEPIPKKLFLIGGPMGVGKTAAGRALQRILPDSVFLDGDRCWDARPFRVTEETKEMVLRNVCYLLNSFLRCTAYRNVIFCWVLHEQSIVERILAEVDTSGCAVKEVSLICGEETLRRRILADVARGVRTEDVLARSLGRLPLYRDRGGVLLNTDGRTAEEVAQALAAL